MVYGSILLIPITAVLIYTAVAFFTSAVWVLQSCVRRSCGRRACARKHTRTHARTHARGAEARGCLCYLWRYQNVYMHCKHDIMIAVCGMREGCMSAVCGLYELCGLY